MLYTTLNSKYCLPFQSTNIDNIRKSKLTSHVSRKPPQLKTTLHCIIGSKGDNKLGRLTAKNHGYRSRAAASVSARLSTGGRTHPSLDQERAREPAFQSLILHFNPLNHPAPSATGIPRAALHNGKPSSPTQPPSDRPFKTSHKPFPRILFNSIPKNPPPRLLPSPSTTPKRQAQPELPQTNKMIRRVTAKKPNRCSSVSGPNKPRTSESSTSGARAARKPSRPLTRSRCARNGAAKC